jgi:O-antigen/teichoic acid export membrane protein
MFRSAGITFGSKLLVALVNFAIVVLLSQWLGEAGKGRCSQYLLIFSAALIFSECISGSTVVYLLAKYSHRQLLLLFYSWSALAAIVTGFLFQFISHLSTAELGWIIFLNWINAIVTIHQLAALGKQKLALFNLLNISQALLTIGSIVCVFIYMQQSPLAYLWSIALAWTIVAIAGFAIVYFLQDDKPFTSWKKLAGEGFKTGIANQTGTFLQLINTRIAYLLLPAAGTGIYSNAASLCEACLLLNSSIGTVQYSQIAAMNTTTHEHRQQQIASTHQCFWASAVLMLVALLVLGLIPSQFYSWLFGPDFDAVAEPLRLLLPGIFLYSCYIILAYFFSGTGRFGFNNIPALVALMATIVGYSVIRYGGVQLSLTTAALVTVSSYTALFLTAFVIFLHTEKVSLQQWLKPPLKSLLKDGFAKK